MPAPFKMKFTQFDHHFTEISVWKGKDPRPVKFGGDAYWQWGMGQDHNDPDTLWLLNHGETINWAQRLHDGLEGWHSCVLHQFEDGFLFILPEHPDYAHVEKMWNEAQKVDGES
mgnify:CR=1 FL=1|jgi:hypothetical protein